MTLEQVTNVVDQGLRGLLVVLMSMAVLNVLWQVFTRFVISAPSGFTEELARYLLIWVGILGSGYAAGKRSHLALELLPEKLEGRRHHRLQIVIEVCIFTFAVVVMGAGGVRLVYLLLLSGQTSSSLNILVGYVYAAVPLSGLVIAFYSVVHIIEEARALRALPGENPDPEVTPPNA
ncbi:C4-dicarboxylate ABC transporter permease [Salinibacter sp. 10B]|uniref:TRAP transporter small permease n=1 Tax=Salinibacter sp. 10B TaxID=1923971 RepID=UPI000CF448ED|nr:TRAP transporter small permease [Salinibacter sp. 10B]PQJ35394.1 C4-dicarboxylate ABC transporter permease [Salinibacter sp. 10B]